MLTRTATELSNNSGEILEQAQAEPVTITKGRNNRPVAVIMSYLKFSQISDIHHATNTDAGNRPAAETGTLAASHVPVNGPPYDTDNKKER